MAKRKRHSTPKPLGATKATPDSDRWGPWLAGAAAALFVTQPLVAGESTASGDGLVGAMLWIVLGVFWMLGAIGRSRFSFRFGWIDGAVLVLIGWHTLAALWAAKTGSPRPAVNSLWIWVGIGLSFLLARQLFTSHSQIRAMMVAMVAVAVAISGYAIYQRLVELPASWEAYYRDPVGSLQAAGVSAAPGSVEAEQFEKRLYSFEPTGTFSLANSLAGYLAPWLVVAVGVGLARGLSGRRRLWTFLGAAFSAAVIGVGLAWTKSRSAYLAVIAGLPAAWWVGRTARIRSRWKLLAAAAAAMAVLIAALMATSVLDKRIVDQATLSLGYRLQYWRSSIAMIADHPIMGCGPGQFQSTYTQYKLPEASEEIADPHNFIFELWTTAGTPAVLAFLAILALYGRRLLGHRQAEESNDKTPEPHTRATSMVLGGAVLGLLLAWPISLASSVPTSAVTIFLGVPLAIATIAGFFAWVFEGRLPYLLPAVGIAVLLINLLAAGGIGFPGVAGTLWLLLAVGCNALEGEKPRVASRRTALVLLAVMVLLAVACFQTAYGPVLECRWRIERVQQDPARAEQLLLDATKADPKAAEPWNLLAGGALLAWQEHPAPEGMARFEQYQHEFIQRKPNSASAAVAVGQRYMLAYERSGQHAPLNEAIAMYRRAVSLYPTNATYHGMLALALRDAGNQAEFEREAARAFELDALTPHADKKLPTKLRGDLLRSTIPGK